MSDQVAKHAGGRPTIITPELIAQAEEYIQDENPGWRTVKDTTVPSVAGLALWLGIHRDTLYDNEEFSDILAKVKDQQEESLLNNGLNGTYNPTIAKLLLSSKHGYVEKSAQDITTNGENISVAPDPVLAKGFADYLLDMTKNS